MQHSLSTPFVSAGSFMAHDGASIAALQRCTHVYARRGQWSWYGSSMQVDMPEPGASGKGHAPHRGRYKEKFSAMRDKFEKATRNQEVYQKQLELANAKIKKLAAENEVLLDALLQSDTALMDKYFPLEATGQVVGHPPWFEHEQELMREADRRDKERMERERHPEGLMTVRPLAPQAF
ncbi:hypothetical protein NMY22_g20117 [Coprinellus aureogranulatus]|nr:hypothetical protein NMY22_g20117 [Coprinellus aureogranulatus]